MLSQLQAISPIDGRYRNKTKGLSKYFSEFALIQYRVYVEIKYLQELNNTLNLNIPNCEKIVEIYENFDNQSAERIKDIEKTTNHDVKSVEYFIKEKLNDLGLSEFGEFVHFGLTSQDINNTAIPLLLQDWLEDEYIPCLKNLINSLQFMANDWKSITMLAHTHGQPASPTTLGKEIMVFVERLNNQLTKIQKIEVHCKFGGATGNFSAHHVSYPNIDWVKFANNFTNKLNLKRSQYTTQIEHYDTLAELFDNIKRINVILLDFCRDMWQYISIEYFKQKTKEGEIGSSAMPHKVNPIDFENAEGNLGIANSIFSHLSEKLPISRLQRDLTDSTALRNIGVPIAHTHISINSIMEGISKLVINQSAISKDLEDNWIVISEAIQTILRREKYPLPYEALKSLTRGQKVNKDIIHKFIDELSISEDIKTELKKITPQNYIGI
jgi:adenylosuccinate lyase